jgi:hypothetical protein
MEGDGDAAHIDALAEGGGLRRAAEILAVADLHDVERLTRRQHGAMAGTGVVGMAMGDERPRHGADGIDVEIAGGAIEAGGRRFEELLGLHDGKDSGFRALCQWGRDDAAWACRTGGSSGRARG